jgi:UDP-glucose 4-epimerase
MVEGRGVDTYEAFRPTAARRAGVPGLISRATERLRMTGTAVVTGGRGRSGRWVVDHLADEGWHVVCVDLDHPGFGTAPRENVEFRAADLTDRGEALDVVRSADPDAVVHWAAIPVPLRHPEGRVFETNTQAAYNVLTAAGSVGARVVWASSESTYGFPFSAEERLPERVPVTEDHPLEPEDPYGLSKVASEAVAAGVARRDGVPVVSLRPSWINYPGDYEVLDLQDQPQLGTGNFWSYVDVRDVATAVSAALDADVDGHEAVNVMAADNYVGRPTADLFEETFGERPDPFEVTGEQCAFSLATAREVLGWEPEHDWRAAREEAVAAPSLTAD